MPARRPFIRSIYHEVALATYIEINGSIEGFKKSSFWNTAVRLWDEDLKITNPDLYKALDKLEDKEFSALANEIAHDPVYAIDY